jgi:hypothetical protein
VRGTNQDVYRTTHLGRPIYIKLTMGALARPTVVVSFKRDTSAAKVHGESDHDED